MSSIRQKAAKLTDAAKAVRPLPTQLPPSIRETTSQTRAVRLKGYAAGTGTAGIGRKAAARLLGECDLPRPHYRLEGCHPPTLADELGLRSNAVAEPIWLSIKAHCRLTFANPRSVAMNCVSMGTISFAGP